MGPISKLLPQGSASHLSNSGGVVLMLCIASGLAVAFVLYLLFDSFVVWKRWRPGALPPGETHELEDPVSVAPPAQKWSEYLEVECGHCAKPVHVPKARRFKPFLCPSCSQMNPPLKKETMAPVKRFLRWLLYPSFQ